MLDAHACLQLRTCRAQSEALLAFRRWAAGAYGTCQNLQVFMLLTSIRLSKPKRFLQQSS